MALSLLASAKVAPHRAQSPVFRQVSVEAKRHVHGHPCASFRDVREDAATDAIFVHFLKPFAVGIERQDRRGKIHAASVREVEFEMRWKFCFHKRVRKMAQNPAGA